MRSCFELNLEEEKTSDLSAGGTAVEKVVGEMKASCSLCMLCRRGKEGLSVLGRLAGFRMRDCTGADVCSRQVAFTVWRRRNRG